MSENTAPSENTNAYPLVSNIGTSGMLVSFSDQLSEPANCAALAFRAMLETKDWSGVKETSVSLTSVYIGFDAQTLSHENLTDQVKLLLQSKDWYASGLPRHRRLWRIPTVFGGSHGPQLQDAAAQAGVTEAQAITQLTAGPVRVMTLGFAPGQPYLGQLPPNWDIARQVALTPKVPVGALVVALRQLVLFTIETPTGWRHIGQTHFRGFRPESDAPFVLRAGDEVLFQSVTEDQFDNILAQSVDANGGATFEDIK